MGYQQEQNEWDEFVSRNIDPGANLLSVSVCSSDCRIYQSGGSVFKVRRLTPASCRGRLNSLEDECLILNVLSAIPNSPKVRQYRRLGEWEVLEMSQLPPLETHDPTVELPSESLKEFLRVAFLVFRINRLGCAHGDLGIHNVGRNTEGTLSLFDFDQACMARPFQCLLRDFFRLGIHARPDDISLLQRAHHVQVLGPVIKTLGLPKKGWKAIVRNFRFRRGLPPNPLHTERRVEISGNKKLGLLSRAWTLAACSNASSPNVPIAYYSLDVSGINFPGERPWVLRWNVIRRHIDFREKRFLELGCNLGLLSINAKMEGASSCLGLDIDRQIIAAAKLAGRAFEVDVRFLQLDLDSPEPWEDSLGEYDIVSALSVMHWVEDKERVWSFLGRQRAVLYEGHESNAEAEARLRTCGFSRVEILGRSERGRNVLHATRG